MRDQVRPVLTLLAVFTVLTGLLYPLTVTALAQLLFPRQANGSLVVRDGQAVGSALIGQPFTARADFWSRPSATADYAYNATAGAGSNLGPLNPALGAAWAQRIAQLRAAAPTAGGPIPVDLVTASASGLDPDISPAAAAYQVPRVARARGMSRQQVCALVAASTRGRQWGFLGEPRVNVLLLNLSLDAATAPAGAASATTARVATGPGRVAGR